MTPTVTIQTGPNASVRRLLLAALPAALVTLGLFGIMKNLIQREYIFPPKDEPRALEAFVMEPAQEEPVRGRFDFSIPDIIPPPPLAPLPSPTAEVQATGFNYDGAAPSLPKNQGLKITDMGKMPILPRFLRPIAPPLPIYPRNAIKRGLEGKCDVYMSVSTMGRPYNINAKCTDRIFESSAETAISKIEFLPQIMDGRIIEVHNVVYPLEFKLED